MAKPLIHAQSSAKKWGGEPEDYLEIHDFMDSSKSVFPDNRHRALTHNSWFIFIVERVFGHTITIATSLDCKNCQGRMPNRDPNDIFGMDVQEVFLDSFCDCDGTGKQSKEVSVRDICEQHILEDYGGKFIPTPGDYLEGMEFQPWMNNAIEGAPSSHRKLAKKNRTTRRRAITLD